MTSMDQKGAEDSRLSLAARERRLHQREAEIGQAEDALFGREGAYRQRREQVERQEADLRRRGEAIDRAITQLGAPLSIGWGKGWNVTDKLPGPEEFGQGEREGAIVHRSRAALSRAEAARAWTESLSSGERAFEGHEGHLMVLEADLEKRKAALEWDIASRKAAATVPRPVSAQPPWSGQPTRVAPAWPGQPPKPAQQPQAWPGQPPKPAHQPPWSGQPPQAWPSQPPKPAQGPWPGQTQPPPAWSQPPSAPWSSQPQRPAQPDQPQPAPWPSQPVPTAAPAWPSEAPRPSPPPAPTSPQVHPWLEDSDDHPLPGPSPQDHTPLPEAPPINLSAPQVLRPQPEREAPPPPQAPAKAPDTDLIPSRAARKPLAEPPPPAPPQEGHRSPDTEARRRHPRIHLKTEVTLDGETNFFTGFSHNISGGGIFIATHDLLNLGDKVSLTFTIPPGRPIKAQGVVAWLREYNDMVQYISPGMGIQFTDLTPEDKRAVQEFIKTRDPLFYDE